MTTTMRIQPQQTRAAFVPETYNAQARTIDVTWTTGYKGLRYSWWDGPYYEELEVSTAAIRLERLNNGAPVLDLHNQWNLGAVMGVVERAWIEGGEGRATLRFSNRAELQPIIDDIVAGIIRNISVGYVVHTFEITESNDGSAPTYRAIDWEPTEISFVPVGFDPGAQTRSATSRPPQDGTEPPAFHQAEVRTRGPATPPAPPPTPAASRGATEEPMDPLNPTGAPAPAARQADPAPAPAPAPAATSTESEATRAQNAERTRAAGITEAVRIAGLPVTEAERMINAGTTVEAARLEVIRAMANADPAGGVSSANPRVTRDENETTRQAMEGAILLRMAPRVVLPAEIRDAARQFRGMSLLRMAEDVLVAQGVKVRGMTPLEIATRALHSTSDFPILLANVAGKRLRGAYEAADPSYQRWARRAPNAPDFKDITLVQLAGAPDLEKMEEGAEYAYGTAGEGKETYRIATYGKAIGFTRQAMINDDLRGFERILTGFAAAGRRLENRLVYGQLTGNPVMADGDTLFHANHGNLAGAGSAIAVASLGAGRTAIRKQKGLQGEDLNIAPRFLIVPTDLEALAYQYTSANYVPAKPSDTNEFRAGGRTALEPIVEAFLDGNSTTAWYLVGDGSDVDTVEYCWLEGAEGVHLESEIDFDRDGMKLKAREDFAAKAVDFRGVYKNPGS